jgi:hypothetical protein
MRTLSPRQLAVVRAVAITLFDDGSGGVPDDRIAFTLREMRAYVGRVGFQTRMAFRAALLVVQLAPLLLLGKLRRFVTLGPSDRARCLGRLERSRLGLVLVLLKTTLCLHYFEHPDVLARMGYDGQGLIGPAWNIDAGTGGEAAHKLPLVPRAREASAAEGA